MRKVLKLEEQRFNFEVKIKELSGYSKLYIKVDRPIFGPQPFLAIKLKDGRYIWDNLDFVDLGLPNTNVPAPEPSDGGDDEIEDDDYDDEPDLSDELDDIELNEDMIAEFKVDNVLDDDDDDDIISNIIDVDDYDV